MRKFKCVLFVCVEFIICFCAVLSLSERNAQAATILAAYQKIYGMNFEIWRPQGLPAGWFVTFDGYPVAQIDHHHWVYGVTDQVGSLVPTDVAVGSVIPMDVPQLARVVASSWRSGAFETEAFRKIALSGFDNIGVLEDPLAYTPIAWKSGRAELRIWLGDRWYRVVPQPGQRTSQALMAHHPFILRRLSEKNNPWTRSDTEELADLARTWGFVWNGSIRFASLTGQRSDSNDNGSVGSSGYGGGSSSNGPSDVDNNSGGGQWDIGGDGGSSGGNSGGGWDTGNSGGDSGGNSGGWDSGGSGGGNSGGSSGGGSGGGNEGGWDK